MKQELFKTAVNTNFKVNEINEDFEITLTEVSEKRNIGGGFESYDLIFTSPKEKGGYLPQKTWNLTNNTTGDLPLFLVPIGENESSYIYQCVLNYTAE